eukprot:TRINITY_DN8769_c0_g1_i1.p2 TRINITY_DN8769_c0_g1~~TRINITY_DN8769_c0_g1_i1.p2  ORF type:complete len:645 (-),score=168.47 TRINITY_DN8769_c0_g1_i1:1814-3748(-)
MLSWRNVHSSFRISRGQLSHIRQQRRRNISNEIESSDRAITDLSFNSTNNEILPIDGETEQNFLLNQNEITPKSILAKTPKSSYRTRKLLQLADTNPGEINSQVIQDTWEELANLARPPEWFFEVLQVLEDSVGRNNLPIETYTNLMMRWGMNLGVVTELFWRSRDVEPSVEAYTQILRSIAAAPLIDLDFATQIYKMAIAEENLPLDAGFFHWMQEIAYRAGAVNYSSDIIKDMANFGLSPDSTSIISVIREFVQAQDNGNLLQALPLLFSDVEANASAIVTVMEYFARNNLSQYSSTVVDAVINTPDLHLSISKLMSLIETYASNGDIECMEKMWKYISKGIEMRRYGNLHIPWDVIKATCTAYRQLGAWESMLTFWQSAKYYNQRKSPLPAPTYAWAIQAASESRGWESVLEIYKEWIAIADGRDNPDVDYQLLVSAAKHKKWKDFERVLNRVNFFAIQDVNVFNVILLYYSRKGNLEQIAEISRIMTKQKVMTNTSTNNIIISAHKNAGNLGYCWHAYLFCRNPNIVTFQLLMDVASMQEERYAITKMNYVLGEMKKWSIKMTQGILEKALVASAKGKKPDQATKAVKQAIHDEVKLNVELSKAYLEQFENEEAKRILKDLDEKGESAIAQVHAFLEMTE